MLVTDLTDSAIYPPIDSRRPGADLGKLMGDIIAGGHFIYAAHPGMLSSDMRRDPAAQAPVRGALPDRTVAVAKRAGQRLLVYALEIRRLDGASAGV